MWKIINEDLNRSKVSHFTGELTIDGRNMSGAHLAEHNFFNAQPNAQANANNGNVLTFKNRY